jgi:hypothetical protein
MDGEGVRGWERLAIRPGSRLGWLTVVREGMSELRLLSEVLAKAVGETRERCRIGAVYFAEALQLRCL